MKLKKCLNVIAVLVCVFNMSIPVPVNAVPTDYHKLKEALR